MRTALTLFLCLLWSAAPAQWSEWDAVGRYFSLRPHVEASGLQKTHAPAIWGWWYMDVRDCAFREGMLENVPERIEYYEFSSIVIKGADQDYGLNGLVLQDYNTILDYPIMLVHEAHTRNPKVVKHEYLHILCPSCDHYSGRYKKCTGEN